VSHLNFSADLILQLTLETVWAFVGMRRRKHILKEYLRYRKHIDYVQNRTLELRSKICKQACLYGNVDQHTRKLYLKYNRYLQLLKQ